MKRTTAITFVICLWLASSQSLRADSPKIGYDIEHAWSSAEIESTAGMVWPQYRGLHGDGVAAKDAKPPIQWGNDKNLVWKTPLPGRAWSSPIVWSDRIWVTDADENGKSQSLIGLERSTGKIVFNQVLFENAEVQPDYHITNSYASSTPVCDSRYVYCHFGAYGTAAVDPTKSGDKAIVWQRRDLPCNHYRGAGSSPILFEDKLIVHLDGFDQQYVVALNRATGETVWKTNRDIDYATDNGDMHKSFATPTVIDVAGQLQLLSPAAQAIETFNPRTGTKLWMVRYEEHSNAGRPIFDGSLVYMSSGFSKAKMLAIDPKGIGDITESNVRWESGKSIACKPSPILHDGKIYVVEDRGVMSCLDATSGETLWQKRLGGDFSSSPIYANGFVYAFDEHGKSYAIDVASDANVIHENQLPEGCMASPIAIGNVLIVRTTAGVYCFKDE
jgi:outer membrane protein assembly factor BamB